jgi:RHS repeat-associated protein
MGWQRLRRGVARLLCWTLLLQSSPVLAESIVLRPEPLGWKTAVRWTGSAHAWMDARAGELQESAESWLEKGELLAQDLAWPVLRLASAAQQPKPTRAPALIPSTPPLPPGFKASTGRAVVKTVTADGNVPLLSGWNLVSLPTRPVDTSPAAVFGSAGSALRRAYAYDVCDSADPWKVYDPADPAGSDLQTVDEHLGLWVDAATAASLPSPGAPPLGTTIHLCTGWNLIGFPAGQARPVQNALISIAGKYQRVFGYDAADAADPWEVFDVSAPAWANDLQLLKPGQGYWILATQPADLQINNQGNELSVEIAQPAQLSTVTAPTTVVGSVQGQALASWELRYRLVGEDDWTTIGSGTAPVTNGALGSFDPTLLLNGLYELELSATDVSGGGVAISNHVEVDGQQKIGNFTVSFVDLEVPLSGLPIQVVRTYDSRERRSRDFGFGWTLDVHQGSYRNNRTPGDGWRIVKAFLPCQSTQETKPHLTTIRLSDRETYRFRLRLTSPAITAGGCFAQARFAFVDGPLPGSTLSILGNTNVFYANDTSEVVDAESFTTYEPQAVRLTTRDGRVFDLNLSEGVTRLADANGNELRVTPTGITHSDGTGIPFTRDAQGRITDITDPLGKSIHYTYDGRGDLISVTDREGNTTHFTYNATHGLLTIEDPRGIQPLRSEYDDSGRLLRHIDAFGKTIEFTHDLSARQEVITDRLGHSRALEYDARGNIIRETDALGKVTTRTFVDHDQLLSETNPLGQTTTYAYDANRNLTEIKDPLGNRTTYTYNARGQVLTKTDARGKTTTNVYDAVGNLLSTTDPLGNVTTLTYDNRGRLLTQTDPEGAVTQYGYDSAGNIIRRVEPLGTEITSTYDAIGNRLTQTMQRTTPAGVESLSWSYEYDGLGRLKKATDPDGTSTQSIYNVVGSVAETIDKLDRHTIFTYDDMGRQIETRYPDNTTEARTYNAEGWLATSTDRGGRTTRYGYDEAGRLLTTTFSDTASETNVYDDAGRLITSTDARNNANTYTHDAGGRRTKIRDALNHEIVFGYDAVGNQIAATDARNNTTTYEYDDTNRLVRVLYPDGTSRETGYDRVGRKISETDQAGVTTHFGYDLAGRLITVTDALSQVTRYAYDEQGNRVSQIDANGNETRLEYDKIGRPTKRTLPGGTFETFGYDIIGNRTSRKDFKGAITTYTYDAANRLLSRSAPFASFTYTATGRRETATDARGTTYYAYDSRDRLTDLTYPDGRKLIYTYDLHGNRTSLLVQLGSSSLKTSYTYDALNRLETVTDPQGRIYAYGYDGNGNHTKLSYPNGIITTYDYDALNRLTGLTTKKDSLAVQSYAYTLGPTGNRMRIEEQDSTVSSYTYDVLYRLTGETAGHQGTTVYKKQFVYDPVGNRLQQTHIDSKQSVTTTNYTYDSRDRLTTEGAKVWSWDLNGNLTGKAGEATYGWDSEDRLQSATLADGTVVTHSYDPDGVRVKTETRKPDGTSTTVDYLVDTSGRISQVVAETGDGALTSYYVRGDDDLVAVMRPGAEAGTWSSRFYHADGLGSIRVLTDEAGSTTDRWSYTAFGELLEHVGNDINTYLFAGEQLDPNSGFYYLRARWMSPESGTFCRRDPVCHSEDNPVAANPYTYAAANPVTLVDPWGEQPASVAETTTVGAANMGLSLVVNLYLVGFLVHSELQLWESGVIDSVTNPSLSLVAGLDPFVDLELGKRRIVAKNRVEDEEKKSPCKGNLLYHYTDWSSAALIVATQYMLPTRAYPERGLPAGVYATDIEPWTLGMTRRDLAELFYFNPATVERRALKRLTHFVVLCNDRRPLFAPLAGHSGQWRKPDSFVHALMFWENPML